MISISLLVNKSIKAGQSFIRNYESIQNYLYLTHKHILSYHSHSIKMDLQSIEQFITFQEGLLLLKKKKYSSHKAITSLSKDNYFYVNSKFEKGQQDQQRNMFDRVFWEEIVSKIKQIKMKKITFVVGNYSFSLFQKLTHINFDMLLHLTLKGQTNINIERLNHLKAPKLETLSIAYNLLTSEKSLRKFIFPDLKVLCLQGNFFKDLKQIFEMVMTSLISIDLDERRSFDLFVHSLNWLFKLSCRLNHLKLYSFQDFETNRINRKFLQKTLSSKHSSVTINISGKGFVD